MALTPEGRVVAQRIVDAIQAQQTQATTDWSDDDALELEHLLIKLARGLDALPQHPLSTVTGVNLAAPPLTPGGAPR